MGKLGATILRIFIFGLALFYGFDLNGLESAGLAIVGDFGLSAIKKFKITVEGSK